MIIKASAFDDTYDTLQELQITNTELGSNELIHQLASKFKNLTTLILRDNKIQASVMKIVAFHSAHCSKGGGVLRFFVFLGMWYLGMCALWSLDVGKGGGP